MNMHQERIAQYLSGRMTDGEADAFEADCTTHEDLRQDLEQTLQFREGLARLREAGKLDRISDGHSSGWLSWAIAASLVVCVVAGFLWWSEYSPVRPLLSTALPVGRPDARALVQYRFVAMRDGAAAAVTIPSDKGTAALMIRPDAALAPGASSPRYRVRLERDVDGQNDVLVAETSAVGVTEEGFVIAYLAPDRLPAGRYDIILVPDSAASPGSPHRFPLAILPPAH